MYKMHFFAFNFWKEKYRGFFATKSTYLSAEGKLNSDDVLKETRFYTLVVKHISEFQKSLIRNSRDKI